MTTRETSWRGIGLIVALLLFAFAFQGTRALYSPDEGRYTAVALQMVESGDWIHPRLHEEVPHYTKPPFTYWMLAAAFRAFGENAWAARLPNALAFVTGVLMMGRIGRRLLPQRPWLPAFVYATFLFPYLGANLVTTDTLLAAGELLAMWGFTEAWYSEQRGERVRWGLMSAVGAALAFLTKGPPSLLPMAAALAFVLLSHGRSGVQRLWSLRAMLLFVVLASWWYLKVALDKPDLLRYFLVEEVWHRVASGSTHRNEQWYGAFVIYGPTLLIGSLPWTPWLFAALVDAWRHRLGTWERLRHDPALMLPLCWLLLPLGVFVVVRSRLPLYVLPAFAPLSILAARRMQHIDFSKPGIRFLLALWLIALMTLRVLPRWLDVSNDDQRLAEAIHAVAPYRVNEIAFVETAPRYGLRIYLGSEIERLNLPGHTPDPESEALASELREAEGCRVLLVDADELAELQDDLDRLGHAWRVVGDACGYRVLRSADEHDCGPAR